MAVDSGSSQVAARVAEELDIPHVSAITRLSLDGNNATVERDVEGDVEIWKSSSRFCYSPARIK